MFPTMPGSARRTAMHKLSIAALGLAALLAGCAGVNPDYTRPAVDLPQAWRDAPAEGVRAQEAPWWKVYGDPVLDRLIEEALANNASVMLALARVDEARAALGATSAEQLPYVTASANRNRTRLSQRGATPLPPGFDPEHNDTRVSADVSYEIDLWGRLRNATQAARAELLATEAARETVRIALTSDVAQGYFALRALDAQLAATRRSLATRTEALELQKKRAQCCSAGAPGRFTRARSRRASTPKSRSSRSSCPRGCLRICSCAGRISCRRSRRSSPPTPASRSHARRIFRGFRSPALSAARASR